MANRRTPPDNPPTAVPLPARFLTPEDIASLFGVPLETVYQWRRKHTGPPGFRVGRHLRYHPDAVAQWVTDQTQQAA
ncbi:helix-turn-helix domain-containing protein [Kitasatospora sp. NPDC058115]|uniref:helix-turn-helix domain-containing protein n=1 Tax=Kitasatospora sp. NPDC058115 TaxID=3346347 RepID=UPI0036D9DA98